LEVCHKKVEASRDDISFGHALWGLRETVSPPAGHRIIGRYVIEGKSFARTPRWAVWGAAKTTALSRLWCVLKHNAGLSDIERASSPSDRV
jgi:hypothetical protein